MQDHKPEALEPQASNREVWPLYHKHLKPEPFNTETGPPNKHRDDAHGGQHAEPLLAWP